MEETFCVNGVIHEYNPRQRTIGSEKINDAYLEFKRLESKIYQKLEITNNDNNFQLYHVIGLSSFLSLMRYRLGRKELLIESDFLPTFVPLIRRFFSNISIYHIDPRLPKRSTIITGKNELESDGNNLAIVLKNILANKVNKEKFTILIKNILPFVDDLAIERFSDRSLIASLKETYSGKKYFPASLLSDGTINIISLIIILYFENKSLIIIEEPTRAMHPSLIEKFINMIKDICNDKQIIVTTHNPQIIKYTDLNNLYFVRRNKTGYTEILNIDEIKNIKTFLKKDIGIDELYIDNLIK